MHPRRLAHHASAVNAPPVVVARHPDVPRVMEPQPGTTHGGPGIQAPCQQTDPMRLECAPDLRSCRAYRYVRGIERGQWCRGALDLATGFPGNRRTVGPTEPWQARPFAASPSLRAGKLRHDRDGARHWRPDVTERRGRMWTLSVHTDELCLDPDTGRSVGRTGPELLTHDVVVAQRTHARRTPRASAYRPEASIHSRSSRPAETIRSSMVGRSYLQEISVRSVSPWTKPIGSSPGRRT